MRLGGHYRCHTLFKRAPPAPQQMLNTAGIGQFIPNTVTSMMIGGCALPANSEFCFDFVNLQVCARSNQLVHPPGLNLPGGCRKLTACQLLGSCRQLLLPPAPLLLLLLRSSAGLAPRQVARNQTQYPGPSYTLHTQYTQPTQYTQ